MKTILEAAVEHRNSEIKKGEPSDAMFNSRIGMQTILDKAFEKGAEFAQQWISVDEEIPKCELIDEEGIKYSECILIKSQNLEFPVTGIYVLANDDEFFDTFSVFEVLQSDITHWRPISFL